MASELDLDVIEKRAKNGRPTYRSDVFALVARVRELEAAVERVRELHPETPWVESGPDGRDYLRGVHCEGCREAWPCATIRALEGATDE